MIRRVRVLRWLTAGAIAAAFCPAWASAATLQAFADEASLQKLLAQWKLEAERQGHRLRYAPAPAPPAPPTPLAQAPAAAAPSSTSLDTIEVTGSRIQAADIMPTGPDSITNIQTQGVDEGDIVKKAGDYLIVLRRGRLFTLRIGGDQLRPLSAIDAFAPGVDASGTWIDEMLVSHNTVVVIGYSYDRGGTEVGLFDLSADGRLSYRSTYQLRSADYYSERNYASRLIGRQLIFYAPVEVRLDAPDPYLPGWRRWRPAATPDEFKRLLPATRIYRGIATPDFDEGVSLHTVTLCDLDAADLACRATAVLGDSSREFYVSEDAVYVWSTAWSSDKDHPKPSSVFRLPLDGSAPTALRTIGAPVDQMSFLQRDGHLNVLIGTTYDGQAMWRPEAESGEAALLRVPLSSFGDLDAQAPARAYRPLPGINVDYGGAHNRYIGDWLVYGSAFSDEPEQAKPAAYALRYADAQAPLRTVPLPHGISRIESLGDDALLVGPRDTDLHFTSLRLGERPAAVASFVYPDTFEADQRTHGFFYRPTAADTGIVGLPILREDPDDDERPGQASVAYLRNRSLRLSRMGQLDAHGSPAIDDGCRISCVDWYGNARPIFVGERVFALLGYELVEGRIDGERIIERRRVDFGPGRAAAIAH